MVTGAADRPYRLAMTFFPDREPSWALVIALTAPYLITRPFVWVAGFFGYVERGKKRR